MNQIVIKFICKRSIWSKISIVNQRKESTGLKYLNDSMSFIEHVNNMDDIKILKNIIQIRHEKY